MRVICIGISHKTADLPLRERLAMDALAVRSALAELTARWPAAEFVVLSTCNRTEIYTARPVHGHPRESELRDWLLGLCGDQAGRCAAAMACRAGEQAVRHLFSVTAGLDSMVLGEAQIAAQVKRTYAAAAEAGAAGPVLHELFQAALHVAKHVHSETALGAGRASAASAAVEAARAWLAEHPPQTAPCVLTIGGGKIGRLVLEQLSALGSGRLLIANRSAERASELADQTGGRAVPLERLEEAMVEADVVLSSTASPTPLLTRAIVAAAQARRDSRPLLIVDLAVPRDAEPAVGLLAGVSLLDIDSLRQVVERTLASRQADVPAAEAIVAEHAEACLQSLRCRQVAPTLDAMHRFMRQVARQELERAQRKLSEHDDAEADQAILARALHRTVGRILHPLMHNLRSAAGSEQAAAQAAAIRKLFDLDEDA